MSQRCVFTDEFKRDAVRLAQERGSTAEVARDLNVQESVLSRSQMALCAAPEIPLPDQTFNSKNTMHTLLEPTLNDCVRPIAFNRLVIVC